jgi:hypothetical protein
MEPRWWNHGANTCDEIERFEDEGGGAVAPWLLHGEAKPSVGETFETLLGDGGSACIPANALETFAVAAVDGEARVHVEPRDAGDGLVRSARERLDDAQGGLAGAGAEQVDSAAGRAVAVRQRGMLELERIRGRVHLGVERAAESLEQLGDASRDASGELGDFVLRGRGQGMEDERPVVAFAHVDAVERKAVQVHVEP